MTDLQDAQRQAGAVFSREDSSQKTRESAPFAWHFCCPNAEYIAARESAAVFDLSDRTQIRLTGSARSKFLHSFCSNDINSLKPGDGCEAFITSVKVRVIGHVFAFVAEDEIWLDSVAGCAPVLLEHLNKYAFIEDVELCDESQSLAELLVTGPAAEAVLKAVGLDAAGIELWQHTSVLWQDRDASVRRSSLVAVPNFILSGSHDVIRDLWQSLVGHEAKPAGAEAFEAMRIESVFPIPGVDISDDNIAQEVSRTEQAISFTKGCYLGQEPIARLDALGHVNKALRLLRIAKAVDVSPGAILTAKDDEKEIGRVSSAAIVPGQDETVVLAMVRRRFMEPGSELSMKLGSETYVATVSEKP